MTHLNSTFMSGYIDMTGYQANLTTCIPTIPGCKTEREGFFFPSHIHRKPRVEQCLTKVCH